ncbi:MAG TPA: hypothetical protein DCY10_00530 [Clostridiales bacterium]|nr:hypothetical protein [Clostridiales bacterium]
MSETPQMQEQLDALRKELARVKGAGQEDKLSMVLFSGDLDKALAGFIIATGAVAMGMESVIFLTFWGTPLFRKPDKTVAGKDLMGKMFGWMLPKGARKATLSKMNMGGMGTAMIRMVMRQKNVDSLETLIQKAMKAGVKIVACTMSMDIMGIQEKELIDGVELGGVGAYLGDAEESNVNLFI